MFGINLDDLKSKINTNEIKDKYKDLKTDFRDAETLAKQGASAYDSIKGLSLGGIFDKLSAKPVTQEPQTLKLDTSLEVNKKDSQNLLLIAGAGALAFVLFKGK